MIYVGKANDIGNQYFREYKEGRYKKDKIYKMEVKELKGDKSEKQRNMYWTCLRQYALALREPQTKIHNQNLSRLGYIKTESKVVNGEVVAKPILRYMKKGWDYENSPLHFLPTGKEKDGEDEYYVLQSSEDFDTQQYSELIDYLINEIIDNGYDDRVNINWEGV